MQSTPKSLRLQIAIFGRVNAGKSSFLNLVTGQKTSITSDIAGTTTDVVEKAQELLPISSDIKISCWGTEQQTLDSLCPGINVDSYRSNLERLLEIRQKMSQSVERLSRISLQMAVCKTNRQEVMNVLEMAEELGVDRVKLNRAVFLSTANDLQKKEAVSPEDFLNRKEFQNSALVVEGTFLYPKSAMSRAKCPFPGKELWILPDGSTEPCPDPENRFVHPMSSKNRCENCHLFSPDRH